MIKADAAQVSWDAHKKTWTVRIQIGEEVLKRPAGKKVPRDAADEQLRSLAIDTAHGDGYEIEPATVTIQR